jgi:hypothetical protein
MNGAPTEFGFLHSSSKSYYICFSKVVIINNQLKIRRLQNHFGLVAAYLCSAY